MNNWDEYDDISENGDNELNYENIKEKKMLNEAKKLLFLRKFSFTNIKNNELEKIIIDCNYDDKCIMKKINNYLINNDNKSKENYKKYYHSQYKRPKYKHQKQNKKLGYREREIEIDYDLIDNNNNKEENKEKEIKIINNNPSSKSTSENSISSTSPDNLNLKHYCSSDLFHEEQLSPFSNENSSLYIPKNSYVSYLLGDNYLKKEPFYSELKGAKFPSKLFPGVFFDQPIEKDIIQKSNSNNDNFIFNNNNKLNYNWDLVINYYNNTTSTSF